LLYKNPLCAIAANEICHKVNTETLKPFAALRERNTPITSDIMANKRLFGEEIYKLIFVKSNPLSSDIAELKALAEQKNLRVCYEDNDYLEFCRKDADKGIATDFLKSKFGITGETVAFGDTKGDFPMFERANKVYIPTTAKDFSFKGAKQIQDVQSFIVNEF